MKLDPKKITPVITIATDIWDDLRPKLNEVCRGCCGYGLRWIYANEEVQPSLGGFYAEIVIRKELEEGTSKEEVELYETVYRELVLQASKWVNPKIKNSYFIDAVRMEYNGRFFLTFCSDNSIDDLEEAFEDIPKEIRQYLDFIIL